jgi:hypothetical protein
MVVQGKRVLTVEEAKALPPLTEAEKARIAERRRAIFEDVQRRTEAFLAAGGRLPTQEEWEETWNEVHYGDDEDEDDV